MIVVRHNVTPAKLCAAWRKYTDCFGLAPRGTEQQMAALLEFVNDDPDDTPPVKTGLKLWSGSWDGRSTGLVAAKTKKRAVELLNQVTRVSRFHFDGYWSETSNRTAMLVGVTEGVWVAPYNTGSKIADYRRAK